MNFSVPLSGRFGRQIFCLLLIGSLWRGPMPVLHDHAQLSEGTGLQRHLLLYHGSRASASGGARTCPLHWHFAPLRDVLDPNAPPQKTGDDDISAFQLAATSPRPVGSFADWCWSQASLSCCLSTGLLTSSRVAAPLLYGESVRTDSATGCRTILLKGMSFLL